MVENFQKTAGALLTVAAAALLFACAWRVYDGGITGLVSSGPNAVQMEVVAGVVPASPVPRASVAVTTATPTSVQSERADSGKLSLLLDMLAVFMAAFGVVTVIFFAIITWRIFVDKKDREDAKEDAKAIKKIRGDVETDGRKVAEDASRSEKAREAAEQDRQRTAEHAMRTERYARAALSRFVQAVRVKPGVARFGKKQKKENA